MVSGNIVTFFVFIYIFSVTCGCIKSSVPLIAYNKEPDHAIQTNSLFNKLFR
jgi:hypothetical protein